MHVNFHARLRTQKPPPSRGLPAPQVALYSSIDGRLSTVRDERTAPAPRPSPFPRGVLLRAHGPHRPTHEGEALRFPAFGGMRTFTQFVREALVDR
eukprot:8298461-Pyramimonas_sp.AAC.1